MNKRVLFAFFIALVCCAAVVCPAPAYAAPTVDGFMGIAWGATPQDVRRAVEKDGFTFWQEGNDPLTGYFVQYADGLYAGYSVSGLSFYFLSNQLYSVSVSISEKRANIDAAYSDIGRLLSDKYGPAGPEKSLRIPVNYPPNRPYDLISVYQEWSIDNGGDLPISITLKKTPAWIGFERNPGGLDITYTNNALREALKARSRQNI
jgi:hypothetical protein